MSEEMKCPNCGSNKFRPLDDKSFKCVYCGNISISKYDKNREKEEVPVKEVVTRIEYVPVIQQQSDNYNGCRTTFVYIAFVIFLFIVMLSIII